MQVLEFSVRVSSHFSSLCHVYTFVRWSDGCVSLSLWKMLPVPTTSVCADVSGDDRHHHKCFDHQHLSPLVSAETAGPLLPYRTHSLLPVAKTLHMCEHTLLPTITFNLEWQGL